MRRNIIIIKCKTTRSYFEIYARYDDRALKLLWSHLGSALSLKELKWALLPITPPTHMVEKVRFIDMLKHKKRAILQLERRLEYIFFRRNIT